MSEYADLECNSPEIANAVKAYLESQLATIEAEERPNISADVENSTLRITYHADDCHRADWDMQLTGFRDGLDARSANAQSKDVATPPIRGWMRKWVFDGETPHKEKNAEGRWAWPGKFKLVEVTPGKCLNDDVPLVAYDPNREAAVREVVAALKEIRATLPEVFDGLPSNGKRADCKENELLDRVESALTAYQEAVKQ